MNDGSSPSGFGKGALIGRILLVITAGVITFWVFVTVITFYVASLTPAMVVLWRENGSLIVYVAILFLLVCRIALASLRLGVAENWNSTHDTGWLEQKRSSLWLEIGVYLSIALCLALITSILVWSADFVSSLATGYAIICCVPLVSYKLGRESRSDHVSEIQLDYWYIPLSSAHWTKVRLLSGQVQVDRSVPRVPRIEIVWRKKSSLAFIERCLASGVLVIPVLVIAISALVIRISAGA
jgi:hypothetical protein